MMASVLLTKEIDELFDRLAEDYRQQERRSREWAEGVLQLGQNCWHAKKLVGHGNWMPKVKAWGMSYDRVANHMRAVKWGATVEMLMEHGLTGTLDLLKEERRAAKMEAEPTPEPEPDPASEEDGKFCSSTKFDPPPETPPGAGDAPFPEGDEGAADGASGEPAAEPEPDSPAEGDADAIQAAWRTVRERLLGELGEGHFKSWIKPCRIEARGAGAALLAPTRFMRDRVQGIYGERIQQLWHRELPDIELVFEVGSAGPEPQQRLPLSGGHAAATAGNVTLAVSPKTAQGNAPGLRLAAAAVAVGDERLRDSTKLMLVSTFWRYWPGRALGGDVEQLGAPSGLKRSASYDAYEQAREYGYLYSDSGPGRFAVWCPLVEIAAETGWRPPEQFELDFRQSLDRKAVDYLARFSGLRAYG